MALVNVIIPVYNRLEYIGEAIESVFDQTYKNYEILVVDDGSTFDIQKALLPYIDRIRYVRQEHQGLPAARNTGIRHSQGKYIAFLDDDDLFEPQKLERQVELLENDPEIGLVFSEGYVFDSTTPSEIRLTPTVNKEVPAADFAKSYLLNTDIYISSLLIRAQCFDDVGLFDICAPHHEDSDMILRIALHWSVTYSDYPSTRIRHHPNRMSLDRLEVNKCILKSYRKIFLLYPNFKAALGEDGNKKMAELHYSLAQSYIRRENFSKARKELDAYISTSPKPYWKAQIYTRILQLPKPALIFRAGFYVLSLYRRVMAILRKSNHK